MQNNAILYRSKSGNAATNSVTSEKRLPEENKAKAAECIADVLIRKKA